MAVTPATHYRVLDRSGGTTTLETIFGWNRPFNRERLDREISALLEEAEALEDESGKCRSRVRFATIGDLLFAHSGFPTSEQDAVFFGPDTYRFVRLLHASVADIAGKNVSRPLRLIDIGSGTGAGGIYAAHRLPMPTELILADINPKALIFSAINAVLNDQPFATTVSSDVLEGVQGSADLIIANSPYLVDEARRLYRHGGGELGIALPMRIAEQSLARFAPGGRLFLYSGTPIIGGADPFFESLRPLLQLHTSQYSYEEIDVRGRARPVPLCECRSYCRRRSHRHKTRMSSVTSNDLDWTKTPTELEGPVYARFHRELAKYNARHLQPGFPSEAWRDELDAYAQVTRAEGEYIEAMREEISLLVTEIPSGVADFIDWFEELRETGPGQGDTLFPWLAEMANREEMLWFLTQEVAGEAGFDDLLAITQVKMPVTAKLEMARNYWDEMGRGKDTAMHGPLLERLANYLEIDAQPEHVVAEAVALGNAMLALARSRRYCFQTIGALGVIEMTAPVRAGFVDAGLKRLGIPTKKRIYFTLHAVLDVKHSECWNREVLRSLVAENPRCAHAIGEGAVLRLWHGARCFDRYRRHFGLDAQQSEAA